MSCKGLSGRKYRKCMKAYVSQSTKQFPTFNQVKDTVSTTIKSNSINGIRHWKKNSKNPTIKSELKNSISKPLLVQSNDPKDKYPYKLKTHRKKN
jgi:hypothetical protein|tara:strand:+ start:315 stop:599 length:285 start_codon:yes stop_codon:yes gene_type:complete